MHKAILVDRDPQRKLPSVTSPEYAGGYRTLALLRRRRQRLLGFDRIVRLGAKRR
jgi:hypothetical protein